MEKIEIHYLDVGQGDSTVILYYGEDGKPKRSILIDCGEKQAYKMAMRKLTDRKFKTLDVILNTHYDQDHFHGITKIVAFHGSKTKMHGAKVWDRGVPQTLLMKTNYSKHHERLRKLQDTNQLIHYTSTLRRGENAFGSISRKGDMEYFIDQGVIDLNRETKYYTRRMANNNQNDLIFNPAQQLKTGGNGRPSRNAGFNVLFKREEFPIGVDVANYGFDDTIEDFSITAILSNGKGKVNEAKYEDPGQKKKLVDDIKGSEVIQPGDSNEVKAWKKLLGREMGSRVTQISTNESENELGLGFLLKFHNFSCWFGGDIVSAQEDGLTDAIGKLTVLKATHHGSKHANSVRFLESTKPELVIVSTATDWNDTVKLPHAETLKRFQLAPFIENVYLTGLPWDPDYEIPEYLPASDDPYDVNNKFFVAGNEHANSATICVSVNKNEATVEKPSYAVSYLEQNFQSRKRSIADYDPEYEFVESYITHKRKRTQ